MSLKACIFNLRSIFSGKFFAIMLLFIFGNAGFASAQSAGGDGSFAGMSQTELTLLLVLAGVLLVAILVLFVSLYILYTMKLLLGAEKKPSAAEASAKEASGTLWSRLNRRFGAGELVPVSEEKDIMMDHAYDGISELNNHMPPWLKYLFYATIAFGAIYMLNYMVLGIGKSQLEEYQEELAMAEKSSEERQQTAGSSIDENNVTLVSDPALLESAQAIFLQNCAACHAQDGGGTVGPNLTDEYWLHGGSVQDVFKVIKYGVQEKGMIPWQDKLKPEEIQNVASYILTLQGSTPANPKAPQGEKYVQKENGEEEVVSSLHQ